MKNLNAIRIALAIAGISGVIGAIIVNPGFAAEHFSSNHQITMERLKDLQYYRVIALIFGSLLLSFAVLLNRSSERPMKKLTSVGLSMVVVLFLMLFGYNSITRIHDFRDPDTMNFIDIAKNIANGKGITQSTLGFNQKSFSVDDPIPTPLIAQPPLYPMLIALLGLLGIPYTESGLIISTIAYGLILFTAYKLTLELYGKRTAFLSVGLLLLYDPLRKVCSSAFSEPLSILLLLIFLIALIRLYRAKGNVNWLPLLCGLICGLVFATRYALLPLFLIGIVFILFESKRKVNDSIRFLVGFSVPAGILLFRNFAVNGTIMPVRNPSTVGLISNVQKTIAVILQEYTNMLKPEVQAILLIIGILVLTIPLIRKRKLMEVLQRVFFRDRRYLLTIWCLGYIAFLVFARTRVHFDAISSRLIVPSGIIIVLFFSAFIARAIPIKTKTYISIVFIISLFMIQREIIVTMKKPFHNPDQIVAKSERLNWIAKNTTERDLIIGSGAVDIPFYLNRPAALSFQYYPENDVLEYHKIMEFCEVQRKNFENIYLIIGVPDHGKLQVLTNTEVAANNYESSLRQVYGSFFTDIVLGLDQYNGVKLVENIKDIYIFLIEIS